MNENKVQGLTEIDPTTITDQIARSGFFKDFDAGEIRLLAEWMRACSCPAGTFILREGEGENCLCVLLHGAVDIYKKAEPDKHLKIASIRPDETIGEMGVVDGQPFSASAITSQDSIVVMITREDFDQLTELHETLGVKLLRKISITISSRLRSTTGRLADMMANK